MRAALTGRSVHHRLRHRPLLRPVRHLRRTSNYRPFPNAQASRIFLRDLAEHADTLRRVFEEPLDLDPSRHSMKSRGRCAHLAALAKKLEDDGNNQELVAQFLMRCLFTLFAEDVACCRRHLHQGAEGAMLPHPAAFPGGCVSLAHDERGR